MTANAESPSPRSLRALSAAEAECRRCPLYRPATQVVPGKGPAHAGMMLVGEQPGDREDVEGLPFIGPAGVLLDRALTEAGVERKFVFITNAVKHFKFEPRGKRRLHKRPNAYEIEKCRWWLDVERRLIKPTVVVALGATAARSFLGRAVTITKMRTRPLSLADGGTLFVTVHPSSLLRMPDPAAKEKAFAMFVADLRRAAADLSTAS